jgi:hypothetical protein
VYNVTLPEQILLGYDKVPRSVVLKDHLSQYAGYAATFFLVSTLLLSLYFTTTQVLTLYRAINSYNHTKKKLVKTAFKVKKNRKILKKELQTLTPILTELKPYHKLLLHLPGTSTSIYQEFVLLFSKLNKYVLENKSIYTTDVFISLQRDKVYFIVIKGKIFSDVKKDMLDKASNLKKFVKEVLKAKIRFFRNPPRPPVTGFEISIRYEQK